MHSSRDRSDSNTLNSESEEDGLAILSNLIFEGTLVDRDDIIMAGIRDERHISCIESLANTLQHGSPEIKYILQLVFEKRADVAAFLKILSSEDSASLDKFQSLQVVRRLATGQISPPRLGPIVHARSKDLVLAMVASLLENETELIEIAPLTWAAAVHALMSGLDKKEILESFIEELGVESAHRLPKWMHVWSQGNRDAFKIVKSLAGSDDFEIIEAALSIDGISESPACEFVGIDKLVHAILSMEAPISLSERLAKFLRLLARIVERVSEEVHSCAANIVEMDLSQIQSVCSENRMQIDPSNCLIEISGDVKKIETTSSFFTKVAFSIDLSAPKWNLKQIPGILGERPAEVIFVPHPQGEMALWEVSLLVSGDFVASKRQERDGSVVFSIPSATREEFSMIDNASIRFRPVWEPLKLSEAEASDIPSGLPVDVPKEMSPAPQVEICGPALDRLKVLLHVSLRKDRLPGSPRLKAFKKTNLVTLIDPSQASISDILREVALADSVLVDEGVLESYPLVTGVLIGSGKQVTVLLQGLQGLQEEEANEAVSELVRQNLVTLFSPE